jgi:hypothetical protein
MKSPVVKRGQQTERHHRACLSLAVHVPMDEVITAMRYY